MWAYYGSKKIRFINDLENEGKKENKNEPQVSGLTKYIDGNFTVKYISPILPLTQSLDNSMYYINIFPQNHLTFACHYCCLCSYHFPILSGWRSDNFFTSRKS